MRGVPEVLVQYRGHAQQTTMLHRTTQTLNACTIRLLTARRRSGRPENADVALASGAEWAASAPDIPDVYRGFATLSLAENFPLLAVYHARKVLSVRRRPSDCGWAARIFTAAFRKERKNRSLLVRMFFGGPLRAHGLRRAG
jgi:hypothetical protein